MALTASYRNLINKSIDAGGKTVTLKLLFSYQLL